ncbi:MAG TPA: nucleotidyltransferase family protein [Polyangiaceae bacterium]|jgi:molybdenum cofactor cytidylyltransferase|nr:MAG: molybdopterin-guanine dinucleotide biosynthesis protein MobA [Deltaproteobacteria bacterium ADurb.Bin207]HNS97812.1 nucleotidyltransferase family protein [Polyangiaceae bacterium]HPB95138.1 nucleotidyltransferase family protein [Polyangiaceae bacterium]HQF25981.1 nucleotidyltransferase family protein [Polyangiaceae bacterium]HQK18210.1 nucleotidyltransferase family protein [Polyangiaceae bacterium]
MNQTDFTLLILASGRGTRMGGPKALLPWTHGDRIVAAHAHLAQQLGGQAVVVARASVLRTIRPSLPHVRMIPSSAPGCWGPAGSIMAAARAGALAHSPWTLITPVDAVPVEQPTLQRLLDSRSPRAQAVRPRFEGKGGHPVLVRTQIIMNVYLEQGPTPLRDVLRALVVVDVPMLDPRVIADLNTPEAYRAWTGREPRFEAILSDSVTIDKNGGFD